MNDDKFFCFFFLRKLAVSSDFHVKAKLGLTLCCLTRGVEIRSEVSLLLLQYASAATLCCNRGEHSSVVLEMNHADFMFMLLNETRS